MSNSTTTLTKTVLRASAVFGLIGAASGAVSLDITKPPVIGGIGAGPPHDSNANSGQWFVRNGQEAQPFVRSHEFYDNLQGHGGGMMGSNAIRGHVTMINNGTWSSGQPINSFTVHATITNDTDSWEGSWANGTNSHDEFRPMTTVPYVGDLIDTMLTIEFALASISLQPNWVPPYVQQVPEIIATNHDARAWFCFNESADPANPGNYFVPAWDFGTIPLGMTVGRDLTFTVNGSIDQADPRYEPLAFSHLGGEDILLNRTTDLKIGDWVDVPAIDDGTPYPAPPFRSGNASAFHVPEPGSAMLCGMVALLALRRRR